MVQTLITSATSYLPVSEFTKRYDARTIGDWASDNNVRVPAASLATDPNVAAALLSASGQLESAVMVGGRYMPADLAVIVASPGAAQAFVYQLLADLTLGLLWGRRPREQEKPSGYAGALAWIKHIQDGAAIFSTQESSDAGRVSDEVETPPEVVARNGVVVQAQRFFGRRADRQLPHGGW